MKAVKIKKKTSKKMKAVIITGTGGTDKLKIVHDHPKPVLKERDILVKVKASG